MSIGRWVGIGAAAWISLITLCHQWLNLGAFDARDETREHRPAEFRVGFLPVT